MESLLLLEALFILTRLTRQIALNLPHGSHYDRQIFFTDTLQQLRLEAISMCYGRHHRLLTFGAEMLQ